MIAKDFLAGIAANYGGAPAQESRNRSHILNFESCILTTSIRLVFYVTKVTFLSLLNSFGFRPSFLCEVVKD